MACRWNYLRNLEMSTIEEKLAAAFDDHRIAVRRGESLETHHACIEELLKEYALCQKNKKQSYGWMSYIHGFYLLTLAKWFEPKKYEMARKIMRWLDEDCSSHRPSP